MTGTDIVVAVAVVVAAFLREGKKYENDHRLFGLRLRRMVRLTSQRRQRVHGRT